MYQYNTFSKSATLFFLSVFFCFSIVQNAVSAVNKRKNLFFIEQGILTGGKAGSGFSLKNFRYKNYAKKKIERIIIDFGDRFAQNIKDEIGYFHAHMDKKEKRLSIDFSQNYGSFIDEEKLRKILQNSSNITGVYMTMDPVDQSINISFKFKKTPTFRMYSIKAKKYKKIKTSKLIIDLKG